MGGWTGDDPFNDPEPIAKNLLELCVRCDARVAEMGGFCRTCHFTIQREAYAGIRVLADFLASPLADIEHEPQEG